MATLRQIDANRRNSQKSTGPTSVPGKAASSLNALKTGIHAQSAVLPFEDRAAYQALIDEYYRRFQPAIPEERLYVDEIIHCDWILSRLRDTDAELHTYIHETSTFPEPSAPVGQPAAIQPKTFSGLQWRINSTRKARRDAMDSLRQLRPPVPAPAA